MKKPCYGQLVRQVSWGTAMWRIYVRRAFPSSEQFVLSGYFISIRYKLWLDYVAVYLKISKQTLSNRESHYHYMPLAASMSCGSSEKVLASPLFQCANGTALSRSQYVSLLQDTLVKAGFTPTLSNGHILRKGFATSASAGQVTVIRFTSQPLNQLLQGLNKQFQTLICMTDCNIFLFPFFY